MRAIADFVNHVRVVMRSLSLHPLIHYPIDFFVAGGKEQASSPPLDQGRAQKQYREDFTNSHKPTQIHVVSIQRGKEGGVPQVPREEQRY